MTDSSLAGTGQAAFTFTTEREFDAPREQVFRAWTEAAQLKQWFSPRGSEILSFRCDARPGGLGHYHLRAPGGLEYYGRWQFIALDPPARCEFIVSFSDANGGVARNPWQMEWPLQTRSVIEFTEQARRTAVRVSWTPYESTDAEAQAFADGADSMRQGWSGTFDNLADYLAGLGGGVQ